MFHEDIRMKIHDLLCSWQPKKGASYFRFTSTKGGKASDTHRVSVNSNCFNLIARRKSHISVVSLGDPESAWNLKSES